VLKPVLHIYSRHILVNTPDMPASLVTCQRHPRNIRYEDATRKLFPSNLGFTEWRGLKWWGKHWFWNVARAEGAGL